MQKDEAVMSNGDLNWITNFIWGIADDALRDLLCGTPYDLAELQRTVDEGQAGLKPTRRRS